MKKTKDNLVLKKIAALFTLQMFAEAYHATGGMVDPATGSTAEYTPGTPANNYTDAEGLSVEMKTFYTKELVRKASPKLVHEQFGKSAPIPARNGDRAEFRVRKSLPKALTPLVEGVTPAPGNMTIYPVYAEVYQFGSWLGYTDKVSLTAIDPIISEMTLALSEQSGLTNDTVVREIINGGTNVYFAKKNNGSANAEEVAGRHQIDSTCIITVQDVFKMAAILRAKNAPTKDGYYVAIAHPYVLYDLQMSAPDGLWKDVMSYAKPENMLKGETGEIGGVRFVSTSEAKIFKGASFGAHASLTAKAAAKKGDIEVTVNQALVPDELLFRWVRIGDEIYQIESNTADTITLDRGLEAAVDAGATLSQGEGGAGNTGVFSTLFIAGNEAYGVVDIGGKGVEFFAKPLGSGNDPINQRGTVGWKCYKGAVILHEEYLLRYESGSTMSDLAQAN